MVDHKNKWKKAKLMDIYYVVGVIAIPYPIFGVLINVVSKEDIAYLVTTGDILRCICLDVKKMSS